MRGAGLLLALILGACAVPSATPTRGGVAPPPLHGVPAVDLERVLGTWHVIARIPYALERGHVGSTREFRRAADGTIVDRMAFHEDSFERPLETREGRATIVEGSANARWDIDFGLRFHETLTVVYVDPEYRYAVLGHPSRNYAWILARQRYLSDRVYGDLANKLWEQDYHTVRLVQVPQSPEFVGVPGFVEP